MRFFVLFSTILYSMRRSHTCQIYIGRGASQVWQVLQMCTCPKKNSIVRYRFDSCVLLQYILVLYSTMYNILIQCNIDILNTRLNGVRYAFDMVCLDFGKEGKLIKVYPITISIRTVRGSIGYIVNCKMKYLFI
jgi:hypothetical protein